MHCPFLYKVKHHHVMMVSKIMLMFVMVYYILLYMSLSSFLRFTDESPLARPRYIKLEEQSFQKPISMTRV
jgi:hypothetical protein